MDRLNRRENKTSKGNNFSSASGKEKKYNKADKKSKHKERVLLSEDVEFDSENVDISCSSNDNNCIKCKIDLTNSPSLIMRIEDVVLCKYCHDDIVNAEDGDDYEQNDV